jgi:uncharacterized protein
MKLGEFIRSLPPAVEFGIVVVTAFALPILGSLASAPAASDQTYFSTADLWSLIIWEIGILVLLGWFLMLRRWDFARQPLYPSWIEVAQGVMLAIGLLLGWMLVAALLMSFMPFETLSAGAPTSDGLHWAALIAVCIVNPVFEEFLVCAYIVTALQRPLGAGLAVAVSVAIRAAYHTYQGVGGFFYAALIGLIFALWFVRTRQLWPPIVAHAVLDFLPMVDFVE